MSTSKPWVPDWRDLIWIDFNPQVYVLVLSTKAFNERTGIVIGLPMTHAQSNETNPFAVKFTTARGEVGYVLAHQPKSFDWRKSGARPHPWKQVLLTVLASACEELSGIISIG